MHLTSSQAIVLTFLRRNPGWRTPSEILHPFRLIGYGGRGPAGIITPLAKLVAAGLVERRISFERAIQHRNEYPERGRGQCPTGGCEWRAL